MTYRVTGRIRQAIVWAALVAAPAVAAAPDEVVVTTGAVRGTTSGDGAVRAFKGLPFAKPPVGALRWKAPEPPLVWQGVRDASAFGAECSQPAGMGGTFANVSEDCLFLNIWTSARAGPAAPGKGQPVLVWFYGGGFVGGGTSMPIFDGTALARRGIIVVTVNYRTGVMGYLAHPALTRENGFAGNYGLLDQIEALRWIKTNIAAFGGDPARVTISGQSSGGIIVDDLMSAPSTRGLFSQGIVMSGPLWGLTPPMRSKEEAETIGSWFMEARGAKTVEEMRALPVEKLIANRPEEAALLLIPFQPLADTKLLPRTIGETFKLGQQSAIPLMIGSALHEVSNSIPAQTLTQYRAWAADLFGPDKVETLVAAFPPKSESDARFARVRARAASIEEGTLVEAQLHSRLGKPVFLYRWDHPEPGEAGAKFGAVHGGDVPFVFETLDKLPGPWTDADRALAKHMADYWANFVRTGNPNASGLPAWTPFQARRASQMRFGSTPQDHVLTAAELAALAAARRLVDPAIYP